MTDKILCPNCSFCGAQFPGDPKALQVHIFICEKHPAAGLVGLARFILEVIDGGGIINGYPNADWVGEMKTSAEAALARVPKAKHI